MQVHGILKAIFDTQVVSDKFKKREFVLTTEASTQYPQHVSFQITQDKCVFLDQYSEGEEVSVDFNLRGREWSGPQGIKYFNTLECWKIQSASATPVVNKRQATKTEPVNNDVNNSAPDGKDLPF